MNFHTLDEHLEDELELELALWLERAKPNDPYVLKVLTEHYAGKIFRFFLAVLDESEKQIDTYNHAAALTQHVLYKAVQNPQNFKGHDSVRNWLFQIAVNELNSFRNNRGHLEKIGDFYKTKKNQFLYSDEKLLLTEDDEKIITTLERLSLIERIPIVLFYIFQTSTANISQILAVRIPTVHKNIKDFRLVVKRMFENKKQHIQFDDHEHTKFEPWIQLSIDGILKYDPISSAKLNLHLDKCQTCRLFRDYLIKVEKQITSALMKRWPEFKLSETGIDQFVDSYQTPPQKSFPLFSEIWIKKESILLGLLLIAVIISGYLITRREVYHANPMVYPTLTKKPSSQHRSTSPVIADEVNQKTFVMKPTAITGSGINAVQLSDDLTDGTNERRYIYYREPTIKADGRFMIFSTSFTTITDQGPDFANDLYLLDQQTGEMVILNQEGIEYPMDIWDFTPSVSGDGSKVVFQDVMGKASSDDPTSCIEHTDSISCTGVYLYDRWKKSTEIISPMLDENELAGPNILPTISADGRWIAFWSADKDLSNGGGDACAEVDASIHCWKIIVLDRETSETLTIPIGRVNSDHAAWDFEPLSLSGNGELIAFTIHRDDGLATQLKIENQTETLLYNRVKGEYLFLNTSNNGEAGDGESTNATISVEGKVAVFASAAGNLVSNDTNETTDVFVHDLTTHQIKRISVSNEGNQGNNASGVYFFAKEKWKETLEISNDNRFVTFMSSSDNLVLDPPTDCPSNSWYPCTNVYLHDLKTSNTELISIGSHRRDSIYNHISLSPSGSWIAYTKSDADCFQAPICSRVYLNDQDTGKTKPLLDEKFINFGLSQPGAQVTQLFDESMRGISSLVYSPRGGLLASGSNDRSVRLWDISSGEIITSLNSHKQLVSEIDISHDERFLASASHDGTVKIWGLESGETVSLSGLSGSILSIDYSPDGGFLAVGASNAAWVWDMTHQPPKIIHSQHYPGAEINSVEFSPGGEMIAHGSSDNSVWIRKGMDGEIIARLGNQDGDILTTKFSPDGRYLVSGSADAVVNVWEIPRLAEDIIEFENILSTRHADWVNDLAFSPDSKLLAVASFGNEVQVWEIPSGNKSAIEPGFSWDQALSVAFSPNGNQIAVGSSWGEIQLWNIPAP
jgi:RNA polymerase sigma factor (sigma-70 family)